MATTPAHIEPAEPPPQVVFAVPPPVEPAPEPPSPPGVEALISQISEEVGIASTTLFNLAYSESQLQADPPGHNDGGRACGVVQIHADLWGFDCQELKDKPEIGLRFAAEHIKDDTAWKYWSPCSCIKGARNLGLPLPQISSPAALVPNSEPTVGVGVILRYGDVWHIAVIRGISEHSLTIEEFNFEPCLRTTRTIPRYDPHIYGFWTG